MTNKLFIISGPVAVGKTTLAKKMFELFPELQKGTSFTTRAERAGETDDKFMKHVSEEEFQNKIKNNDFIEWAHVHQYYYGTDKHSLLENLKKGSVLLTIDVQGGTNLVNILDNVVLIFIMPDSIQTVKDRLLNRYKGKIDQKDYDSRMDSLKRPIVTHLMKEMH